MLSLRVAGPRRSAELCWGQFAGLLSGGLGLPGARRFVLSLL